MGTLIIDRSLADAVRSGNAVLFLGAGASSGATTDDGRKIPLADDLKKQISKKFLGDGYESADFKTVYDFAASASNVRDLQLFLYETLSPFKPAAYHNEVPLFVWAGILTTNYDLIIERAYANAKLQQLTPCCSDDELAKNPPSDGKLLYVKLHGCISHYQTVNPPLIASTEQIIHHKLGRAGQFSQFLEWAKTKTIIFAGYGMGDANLRTLFDEIIKEGDNRPRHYIVRPGMQPVEMRYWSDRRVQAYPITFQELLKDLGTQIHSDQRGLALHHTARSATTFTRFISQQGRTESKLLREFLQAHCEHVSTETTSQGGSPRKFYEGFDLGWYPIERSLDVSRRINTAILNEQVVATNTVSRTQFAVLKAHAGAGKSVAIRRIAWDAATKHDRLVFYVRNPTGLQIRAFEEILSLTNKTTYVFVDDLADLVDEVEVFVKYARKKNWKVVLIACARTNEWNTRCEALHTLVDEEYELKYLSPSEIDGLLEKLQQHECLGFLASLPIDKRKTQLQELYGRQLLVALHEATKNKSFRDIIRDEYQSIFPAEARLLYRDVCTLHRFGPPVRAGLIGRLHGIRFEDFQDKFLLPLEDVIDVHRESSIGDWVYKARHSYIAQIVYEELHKSIDDKFDSIIRVIGKLNPAFSYDREVVFELVRAATLASDFKERRFGDAIYDAAMDSFGEEDYLSHQRGIYEMRLADDPAALDRAEEYVRRALDLSPGNSAFQHTLAEIAFRRSTLATDEHERAMWRQKTDAIASALARSATTSHAAHTLVKSAIASVKDALARAEDADSDLTHESFSQAVRVAEDRLRSALQRFPSEPYLLTEEAALSEILRNSDRSLRALSKAFEKNPKSELIARRYSKILLAKGDVTSAISALRTSIEYSPGSTALNFDLAKAIRASAADADTKQSDILLYHFQRSFVMGDKNYEAQFWYARQLCIAGKQQQAKTYFEVLRKISVPFRQKRSERGFLLAADGSKANIFGVVYKINSNFGFIRADLESMEIFFEFSKEDAVLEALQLNDRVSFNLAFTLHGPAASKVTPV